VGKTNAQRFEAALEELRGGLGWTVARVPFVPRDVWPDLIRHRVKGSINGFDFRTSLFPFSDGTGFFVLVNKAMQETAGVRLGARATFRLEPDMDERPAELPDELAALLDDEPGLRAFYDSLSEARRRELGKWIVAVKSDEARLNRSRQAAERLLGAMEGERELPPLVQAAFRRRPRAKLGWEKLTPAQRRQELLAVFYYQSPEAREKRVAKLCDLAENKLGPVASD